MGCGCAGGGVVAGWHSPREGWQGLAGAGARGCGERAGGGGYLLGELGGGEKSSCGQGGAALTRAGVLTGNV